MNSIVTLRRTLLGAILLCGIGALALASSDGRSTPTRVIIHYSDLDLAQPKGAEALYRRITAAAKRACNQPTLGNVAQMSRYQQCYRTAVAVAVDKVDARTLTALHRSKTQQNTAG